MLLARTPTPRAMDAQDTKGRLIATCERLLGQRGFGDVALHDIAQQAGQSNKYAVQYHFGDKDGLISAVFATRERFIIERRTKLIAVAEAKDLLGNVEALVELIYLPIAEQVDEDGQHSFARFWMQFFARPDASGLAANPFSDRHPLFERLLGLLGAATGKTSDAVEADLRLLGFINFAALIDRDNARMSGGRPPALGAVVTRTVGLIAAGLRA